MGPTSVDTIAIGQVRRVLKEVRQSKSFSRLAYRKKGVRMLILRNTVASRAGIDRDGGAYPNPELLSL